MEPEIDRTSELQWMTLDFFHPLCTVQLHLFWEQYNRPVRINDSLINCALESTWKVKYEKLYLECVTLVVIIFEC